MHLHYILANRYVVMTATKKATKTSSIMARLLAQLVASGSRSYSKESVLRSDIPMVETMASWPTTTAMIRAIKCKQYLHTATTQNSVRHVMTVTHGDNC